MSDQAQGLLLLVIPDSSIFLSPPSRFTAHRVAIAITGDHLTNAHPLRLAGQGSRLGPVLKRHFLRRLGNTAAFATRIRIAQLQGAPSFGFPPACEEWLLVSDTEALANEARVLKLVEQGHGIIFG